MRLKNNIEIRDLLKTIDLCQGNVWLESKEGDRINLKSELSKYVALGQLIKNNSNDLELFCSYREDTALLLKFFDKHPDTI